MKEDTQRYQERIMADPKILAGKPVIKGTRISVDLVLEELSHNPDILHSQQSCAKPVRVFDEYSTS